MKKLFTLIALMVCLTSLKAQYVTIPDANFVAWLQANVPTAMNGNQMDTTSLVVTLRTRLDIENLGITDLTGTQYFDSLKVLDCGNGQLSLNSNTLTSLPRLPSTLDTLVCGRNTLTSLPVLPSTLKSLTCYRNQITVLPLLPDSLTYLDCSYNLLTSLPMLPSLLYDLDCSHNQITNLPLLPNSLFKLTCSYNLLTGLPNLSSSLYNLICSYNLLTSMPALPSSLRGFTCNNNFLTSIPNLPGLLRVLNCYGNQLVTLPNLPGSLIILQCHNNQLTALPTLPNIVILNCSDNYLTSLPILPNSLSQLDCQNNSIYCFNPFKNSITSIHILNNPFTCLPNYIASMDYTTLSYSLCSTGNIHGCSNYEGIIGFTYKDNNNDCSNNSGDTYLKNIPLKIYDTSNNLLGQTYSALNGVYSFTQTSNTYNVVVDTTGIPIIPQCGPGIDSTVTVALLDTNINFAFTCKPGFDIGVRSAITMGWVFPGQQHILTINAGDMSHWYNLSCANGVSGRVQITVTGNVVYNGPATGALIPIVSGNVYTYTIPDFGAVNNASDFSLLFTTNTIAQAGDAICVDVNVTPILGDYVVSNNTAHFCYYVVNSHDPNKKETYPVDVAPGYNDYFTYTIHFQNTGSAPAFNINLLDTLDSNLDLSTFQVMNYSHANTVQLKGNILSFSFSNIQLPDSTSNLADSQGFVQYRIKPKTSWMAPYKIKNTAYIYFDFNAPVITNTTYNSIMTVTGLADNSENMTALYPNPSNGRFTIELTTKEKQTLQLFDITGNMVLSETIENGKANIDASHLAAGIYNISIKGNNGSVNRKLVIVK